MPGSAAIAMVNAALEGFVRAAALETDNNKKVIVIHPPLVAETAEKMGLDPAPFLTAREVSDAYLEAIKTGKAVFLFLQKIIHLKANQFQKIM
jgi:NAD(P)-dependent dehydrogenase (short-subunit alcohol dehydrogenase family)